MEGIHASAAGITTRNPRPSKKSGRDKPGPLPPPLLSIAEAPSPAQEPEMAAQVSTHVQLPEDMCVFEQRVSLVGIAGIEGPVPVR